MKKYTIWATIFWMFYGLTSTAEETTLIYCSEGSPEGFDAALYTSSVTFDATRTMFNGLTDFEYGGMRVEPSLAEKWDISDDGKSFTFYLRKDVTFHSNDIFTPSRNFNADDVLYSLERQMQPEHPWYELGGFEHFEAMGLSKLLEKIEKIDDYTVKFHLTAPEASFLAILSMDFARIQSKEYMEMLLSKDLQRALNTKPIGTGPWMFQSYAPDSKVRYIANPNYFEGAPNIDRLVFDITPDAATRWAKMQSEECHIMSHPNATSLQAIRDHENIELMQVVGFNIGYLGFHTQKEPFTDPRVRRALSMAVNHKTIIDAVFDGNAQMANTPIPPESWAYNPNVKAYPYDLEAAKQLLAEAGYPDGFETDIWAMPVQRPYNPNARRMAEIIQAGWAKIGVRAVIQSYEWGEYLDRVKKGEHQTLLLGWSGDNGDPSNFLSVLLGCGSVGSSNRAYWCDTQFDTIVEQARQTLDVEERTLLIRQAQEIFHQQAPWVPIAHALINEPVNKKVKNYKPSPAGMHLFLPYILELEK